MMSDPVENNDDDSNREQSEQSNTNNLITLQLTSMEVNELRALMRENEQRKLTEMNNKNIREIKNHTRIIRNTANLSPILNNNRNNNR